MSEQAGDGSRDSAEGGEQRFVTLGRVSGAHGIQGWVKVHSETSPRENIVRYSPWELRWPGHRAHYRVKAGRRQGKAVIAKLEGCNDRDAAEALIGAAIVLPRSRLPQLTAPGEYYWADLEGLRVVTIEGVELGHVDHLFETGANDVVVVQGDRERLIPYVWGQVVREVDLEAGVMRVDWDQDF